MAEQHGTHWRTGGKITNAGCEMLPDGKDIPYIVIESIEYKDKHQVNGRNESGIWVANFAKNPYTELPMILNATNRKRISKMYQTEYIDTLRNIAVRLTKERTRDVQDGGETWGLRIHKNKPTAPEPTPKIVITPESDKWGGAKDFIKSGKTIDDLRMHYDISDEHAKLLTEK